MIFPVIQIESIVQVGDRTRIDVSKSYCTPDDSITGYFVCPDVAASANYFDVTDDKFLDWQYEASGSYTIALRANSDEVTSTISVVTAESDYLFSDDQRLKQHEPDILKWVQAGRNSYFDVHRRCQEMIVDYLDQQNYRDNSGNKYTKVDIVNREEVRSWATFMALRVIFEGLSNAIDDIFAVKAARYEKLEVKARDRASLSLDKSGDGIIQAGETYYVTGGEVVRR